ncbi:MAG: RluA family pseudouridine synthase [Aquificae bacterium]|nr:RluA family pseudouridine synthase [Aquificota bacterium]
MERFKVEKSQRLVEFLSQKLKISKKKAKSIIDTKNVFVNNKRIWIASFTLKKGDVVELSTYNTNQDFNLNILYEDKFVLAVNKPPFFVCDKDTSSIEEILKKQKLQSIKAIHRLDKETSGVLLFAKNFEIFKKFKSIWNEKYIYKEYIAVSHNKADFRKKTIKTKIDTKEAVSIVKTLKTTQDYSLFSVQILTGRKHQIRIHLSKIGHPIVGDKLYGLNKINSSLDRSVKRHMLHAYKLKILHPFLKKQITIHAPVLKDMKNFIKESMNLDLK